MQLRRNAFTLIELLVVIVIIGILATVSTATFGDSLSKANQAKLKSELANGITASKALRIQYESGIIDEQTLVDVELVVVSKALELSREIEDQPLHRITNSTCSRCSCTGALNSFANDPVTVGTQTCINNWENIISTIDEVSSGIDLNYLRTDPWGNPYLLDENELIQNNGNISCIQDRLLSAGSNRIQDASHLESFVMIPFYLEACK